MIIGIGSDLIDIRRVEKTLERFGERFTNRWYAAKEACSKALGTGFRKGVFWRDLGVVNLPGGKPTMQLTGGALKRLESMIPDGMDVQIDLTITDEPPIAEAMVIISAIPKAST